MATEIPSHNLREVAAATVALIRDNLGKRPIYFSWSDGNYPDGTLGLTEYLLTTGLVRKLMPKPIREGNGIVLSKTLGFVDVGVTRQLLWETYHWQSATRKRPRGWVERWRFARASTSQAAWRGGCRWGRCWSQTSA